MTVSTSPPHMQQRWRCDVCEEATFERFEDACQHEKTCQGPSKRNKNKDKNSKKTSTTPLSTSSSAPKTVSIDPVVTTMATATTTSLESSTATILTATKASTHLKSTRDVSPDPPTQKCQAPTVHSFFAPRGQKAPKRPSPTQLASKACPPVHEFFRPGKKVKSAAPSCKVTVEHQPENKSALKSTTTTTTTKTTTTTTTTTFKTTKKKTDSLCQDTAAAFPLANLFQQKGMEQFIAEQRQAEFQAQRRKERHLEQKRQQRRAAAAATATTTNTIIATTTKPKIATLPAHCRMSMAPRFPLPSLVVAKPYETPLLPQDATSYWMDLNQMHRRESRDARTIPSTHRPLVSTLEDLDACENLRDLQEEALRDLFKTTTTTTTATKSSTAHSDFALWSQKYGPAQGGISQIVGHSAEKAASALQTWIQEWCGVRQRALDRMKERQERLGRQTKKGTKTRSRIQYKDDEDRWRDEEDDEDLRTNLYVLTGPCGSGKTSLVHAVAKECQCSVLEIHTAKVRSGSALKHSIQEATQSCSTKDLFQKQRSLQQQQQQSLFQPAPPTVLVDSEDEENSDEDATTQPKTSVTVILIDEVDLIYETEGDAGFWTALASVAKTAQCPIVLTANEVPQAMANWQYFPLTLERPTPTECATKILQVCRQEQMTLRNIDQIPQNLEWLAKVFQCDLRKILLQLQLFHVRSSSSYVQNDEQVMSTKLEGEEKWVDTLPAWIRNRPMIHSVVPSSVPADQFTVLTVHGQHFSSLGNLEVELGKDTNCRSKVVDDERILILCPPCRDVDKCEDRVVPLSLLSSNLGVLDGSWIETEELADGSSVGGKKNHYVEYLVGKTMPQVGDSEEHEFEGTEDSVSVDRKRNEQTLEDGLRLWERKIAEETSSFTAPNIEDSAAEKTVVDDNHDAFITELDALAYECQLTSDAAHFEEFLEGVPFLSGACHGFGFVLTEEGSGFVADHNGKLQMNDNCRPPSLDRLFANGWNENCFFHGAPETYMVNPKSSRDRSSLLNTMRTARGGSSSSMPATSIEKDDEAVEDVEDMVRNTFRESEEDMFLPNPLPILVQSLPEILRRKSRFYHVHWSSNQILSHYQEKTSNRVRSWLMMMFEQSLQITKTNVRSPSRELFCFNGSLHPNVTTGFLPILCRIGAVEEALAVVERQNEEQDMSSSRRSTRRRARNSRRHYFDVLSKKLAWDEAPLSATELGREMAQSLLTYSPAGDDADT